MCIRYRNINKKKQEERDPSPLVNPTNQLGSGINSLLIWGLVAGIILGKAAFNDSDKPKFI